RTRADAEQNGGSTSRMTAWVVAATIAAILTSVGVARHLSGDRQTQLGFQTQDSRRSSRTNRSRSNAPEYSFNVVNAFPHDDKAFCQGLAFDGTTIFESTGQYGKSTVRRVNLESGKPEKSLRLDRRLFGEGLTLFDGKVFQLTWKRQFGYIYDAETLKFIDTFRYAGEGWGLTHNGEHLIMSDGTDRLRFIDPKTFAVVKTIRVKDGRWPVQELNELEFVEGQIFANVWHSDRIAIISPDSGNVTGWIDLTGLLKARVGPEAVLNGIAYGDNRLFVTGKHWPQLFEIKLVKK
ncbi:MAG: glutaminyl-peptide cyclotransferase, partial [Planctomycetota bacterium]